MRKRNDNIDKSIQFTIIDEQQKPENNILHSQSNVPSVFSRKSIWKIRGTILFLLSVLSVLIVILLSSKKLSLYFFSIIRFLNMKMLLRI